MGGGGEAPKAPDPNVVIPLQEQADMRKFYAQLDASRSNASTPYGSSTWSKTPVFDQSRYDADYAAWNQQYGNQPTQPVWIPNSPNSPQTPGGINPGGEEGGGDPGGYWQMPGERPNAPNRADYQTFKYDNKVAFNPEMQAKWDQIQGLQGDFLKTLDPNQSVDLIDSTRGMYNNELADAIFRRTTRLAGPELDKQQSALEQRLAERGFQVGNEGFNNEMTRFGTMRGDLYADAADRAQITAAQQALQEANFTNSSRLAEFQGNNSYKQNIIQLLAGLEGQMGSGLAGTPTSFNAPGMQGTDVLGAYNNKYQGDLNAYNASVAEDNAMMNAMMMAALTVGTGGMGAAAGAAGGLGTAASMAGTGLAAMGGAQGLKAPAKWF